MFKDYDPQNITARLLAMIGEPYEQDGCIKFVRRALWEFGVQIEGTKDAAIRDSHLFRKVETGALGTVILWQNLPWQSHDAGQEFHIGLMLDRRWAIQSSSATFGVARIEITRHPWIESQRGFYRPKALCT
jgi:hypothetical protein